MASLINKKPIKDFAILISKEYRNGKFTRVGQEFIDKMEAQLKLNIIAYVKSLPSVGKTIL